LLVISHEPLGTALLSCTRHVFGATPPQTAALDVLPNEDPQKAVDSAKELVKRISDGSGVLVLTDLHGATPSRIAKALFAPHRVAILGGVSLPMVIKALSLRRTPMPLTDLVDQVKAAGEQSIQEIFPS
jgi:mannose PTS system EIIA component